MVNVRVSFWAVKFLKTAGFSGKFVGNDNKLTIGTNSATFVAD